MKLRKANGSFQIQLVILFWGLMLLTFKKQNKKQTSKTPDLMNIMWYDAPGEIVFSTAISKAKNELRPSTILINSKQR